MHHGSSWRRVGVVLSATATAAALFATPAFAKPSKPPKPAKPSKASAVATTIDCSQPPFSPAGVGTVTVYTDGVAKGHCSFPNGFPNLGLPTPGPGNHHAVHIACADLAKALAGPLGLTVVGTPTGEATLTPSGHANVNCRNVNLVANSPSA